MNAWHHHGRFNELRIKHYFRTPLTQPSDSWPASAQLCHLGQVTEYVFASVS